MMDAEKKCSDMLGRLFDKDQFKYLREPSSKPQKFFFLTFLLLRLNFGGRQNKRCRHIHSLSLPTKFTVDIHLV